MILFFYNLALLAALVVGAPWWLFRMATTQKYREGLRQRLGRVPQLEGQRDRPLIWVHAVSVGEVLAVSRLVKTLDAVLPGYFVAISTTTRTGQELARERFGANRVFYCPLDLPWAVRAYLKALEPRMLVLAETEFWPNLLSGCFRREIPVAVVNARISDRSYPRYMRLRALWRPFLERIECVLAQSETDDQRLIEIGCDPDRVSVAGNLKFDIRAAWEADATRTLKALKLGNRVVVAGSTLEGEEAALLEAWPKLLEADPKLVMVVAPRHPERFDGVAALLGESGFSWKRRTDWLDMKAGSIKPLKSGQIVLLDTIGELASVYSLASAAFVGGSLIPAGGHNPLEPAQFAVPIVIGPNYANFRDITEYLRAHDAIRIAEADEFADVLVELLTDHAGAQAMGERARQVFEQQSGATERCVLALRKLIGEEAAPANAAMETPVIAEPVERRLEPARPLIVQAKSVSMDPPAKLAPPELVRPTAVSPEPAKPVPVPVAIPTPDEAVLEDLPEAQAQQETAILSRAETIQAVAEPVAEEPVPVLVEPVETEAVMAAPIQTGVEPEAATLPTTVLKTEDLEATPALPESILPFMPWLEMTRPQRMRMEEPLAEAEPLQAEFAAPEPIQIEPEVVEAPKVLPTVELPAQPGPDLSETALPEPVLPARIEEIVPPVEPVEPVEPEPVESKMFTAEPPVPVADLIYEAETLQAEPPREPVLREEPEVPTAPEVREDIPAATEPILAEQPKAEPEPTPAPVAAAPAPLIPDPVGRIEVQTVAAPVPALALPQVTALPFEPALAPEPVLAAAVPEPVVAAKPLRQENAPAPRAAQPGFATRKFLLPLVPLYRLGQAMREGRKGAKPPARLRHPVVSIGNLSTGGAGKTPLTIALVAALGERGFHVDVLSRGFGRTGEHAIRVALSGTAEEFGDEPMLIARATGAPVYVANERSDAGMLAEGDAAAIAFLGEKVQPVIHLLDDGFQHRQLARALDILLLDREDWAGTLLPAGNLREPLSSIHRAQVVAIPEDDPDLERELRTWGWQGPVWRLRRRMTVPAIDGPVSAFCGIARPGQFFSGLEAGGVRLATTTAFPDHHPYTVKDMDRLLASARGAGAVALVTTEKDEVRLGTLLAGIPGTLPLRTAGLRTEIVEPEGAIGGLLAQLKLVAV